MRPARLSGRGRVMQLWALLAAAAVLAGCTTPLAGRGTAKTPASTPVPTQSPSVNAPTIKLSDCSKLLNLADARIPAALLKHLSIKCGKVTVPLDYDDPDGATIDVQVLRLHDDQQTHALGSLVINPGGPGGAGLTLPIELAGAMSQKVLQSYDIVGFDPRGVGVSGPVQCVSNTERDGLTLLDPDVLTPDGFLQAQAAATEVAEDCALKLGPALPDYNTVYTAMDLDRIRAALGQPKLNYLGFSYGTELGRVYAHLYPTKVATMVLDGAVDPSVSYITALGNQLGGFELAFDQFAADCATKPACNVLGDPRSVVTSLVAAANVKPMTARQDGQIREATGGTVTTAVLEALYSEATWPALATALINAQKGDPVGIFALADAYTERDSTGDYSNLLDAYTIISCNDAPAGLTDATIHKTVAQWTNEYPMFGNWGSLELFNCENWQPVRHVLPPAAALGAPPILVVGTIHDPATPYAGAEHLASALKTGVLLTWDGQGHTAYLKSECIDDAVDAFLVNAIVPPAGTVCPE